MVSCLRAGPNTKPHAQQLSDSDTILGRYDPKNSIRSPMVGKRSFMFVSEHSARGDNWSPMTFTQKSKSGRRSNTFSVPVKAASSASRLTCLLTDNKE